MARDIEEFLRKAAERRRQQKRGGDVQPPQPNPRQQAPQWASQQPAASANDPLLVHDVEIIEEQQKPKEKKTKRRDESIADQSDRYLDTTDIKKKMQSLGSQIAQTSQQFASTVHSNLDHDICSVDDDREAIPGQRSGNAENSMANQLKNMLIRPESVAQAFLIAEIINRPKSEDD